MASTVTLARAWRGNFLGSTSIWPYAAGARRKRVQTTRASAHPPTMTSHPYAQLVRYKQWADRGLHDVVAANLERLDPQDRFIVLRVLDHIHVVDRVFQHHLQ